MTQTEYMNLVHQAIFDVLCVSEEMLKSPKRNAKYVDARKIFSYLCRVNGIPYSTIGETINRGYHTVSYQVETFVESIKFDKVLFTRYCEVKSYIENKLKTQNAKILKKKER